MGINLNDRSVNSDGITLEQFKAGIKDLKQKEQEQAIKIFNFYAGQDDVKETLSQDEATRAYAELAKMNTDGDEELTKKELKRGREGTGFDGAKKSAVDAFLNAISGSGANEVKLHYGNDADGNVVVTAWNDKDTAPTADDTYQRTTFSGEKPQVKDFPSQPQKTQPETPKKPTQDEATAAFFQYITGQSDFDGTLINDNHTKLNLPAGCEYDDATGGIKYDGKVYVMRGTSDSSDDPLRFECDENKKTLQQALLDSTSDDAVHKYHNHGESINKNAQYDSHAGTINHGKNQDSVSQAQTFASMLMNGNENSTLTLDNQKGVNGKTAADIILDTIDADNAQNTQDGEKEISMQELISYVNAAYNESQGITNATGARKFARGVDLDAKDLANIGAVFKKYDSDKNGKLNKSELEALLNDLKNNSMSKLAKQQGSDNYIGDKNKTPDGDTTPHTDPQPTVRTPQKRTANRTRNVVGMDGEKTGDTVNYEYKNGLRTVVSQDGNEDLNGNIAEESDPTFGAGKKRFVYIQGLPTEVNAELVSDPKKKGDENRLVKVKDRNGNIRYFHVKTNTTEDGKQSYSLGDEVVPEKGTKLNEKYKEKKDVRSAVLTQLHFGNNATNTQNIQIPENLTVEYGKDGKLKFKLDGRECSNDLARVTILRYNVKITSPSS